jgi:hypothetical protein
MRIIDSCGVVPLLEPADYQAGIDSDSFTMAKAAGADLFFQFGTVTGDAVLTLYCGASAGTKTTAVPFRYRLSSGDFKAASADQFASSDTSDADGALTLTAATYDHRVLVIEIDGAELDETKPWITAEFSAAADALNLSGIAILTSARYQPAPTQIA